MVINDARRDLKTLCEARGELYSKVGISMGHPRSYTSKIKRAISAEYEKICEELGYDIVIAYDEDVPFLEMLHNDPKRDLKRLSKGRDIELKKPVVNQRFYDVCRYLGFGIKLIYKER